MAHFFEIFRNLRARIFFLQLLDHAVHQHRRGFLLQITHFARQFARKRKRLAVNHRKFLAELIVFPLQFLRRHALELPFLHHLRNFLDGHHLPLEHRKNFRQRHRAHLHPAQRKLLARNAAGEIVHQFLFALREALHDPRFLPLEGLAFEYLRNAPAQKIDSRFHFLLERIRLPARQSQQPWPVRILEIIHVGAVRCRLALRMHLFDHADDHAAAARPGKPAHEKVVAGGRQVHAHPQSAQRPLLPGIARPKAAPLRWSRMELCWDRNASEVFPAAALNVLVWNSCSFARPKGATLARPSFSSHSLALRCFHPEHSAHRGPAGSLPSPPQSAPPQPPTIQIR